MAKVLEAVVQISGKDLTGNLFAKIGDKAAVADRKLQQVNARQKAFAQAGRMVATAASDIAMGLGAAEIVRRSAVTYMELEKTMTNLGITAGATDQQIHDATKTLQEQAPVIGQTGQQWGEVAQNLVAAGMSFNDALGATPIVARTARAETADLVEVSAAANASMQNLGVTVGGLGTAMDMMAAGGKAGSFELKNMAREFPSVAASASRLGFQGTDGVARLVSMLEVAVKTTGDGAQAATNMRQAFDKMYSPTVQKAFGKTFHTPLTQILTDAAKAGKNQFEAVLDFIDGKTKGMSDTAKQSLIGTVFNDEQARNGILAMMKFRDDYQKILADVKASGGTVDRDLDRVLGTTAGKWDRMVASLNRAGADLGEAMAPGIQSIADNVTSLTQGFETLRKTISLTGTTLTAFTSGASPNGAGTGGKQEVPWYDTSANGLGLSVNKWVRDNFKSSDRPIRGSRGLGRTGATNEEVAGKLGSDLQTAFVGPKLSQPKDGAGWNETLPYALSSAVHLLDDTLKRFAGPQSAASQPNAGGDLSLAEIAARSGGAWATPPEWRARNIGWTPPSSGKDAPSAPQPIDVTGKVAMDPASKATVQVVIKVDGPGTVAGMSASAGGNLKANVGVSMAPGSVARRDE